MAKFMIAFALIAMVTLIQTHPQTQVDQGSADSEATPFLSGADYAIKTGGGVNGNGSTSFQAGGGNGVTARAGGHGSVGGEVAVQGKGGVLGWIFGR